MVSSGPQNEVGVMSETLENHVVMQNKQISSAERKGIPAPNPRAHQSDRIPDELFQRIWKIFDIFVKFF